MPIRSPSFLAATATLVTLGLASFNALSRELPAIDRLGEAPVAASMLKRTADPATHMQAQLGLPTFAWGDGGAGGAAAGGLKSIVTPGTDPTPLADPVALARGHLKRLGSRYALPESLVDPLPVKFSQPLKSGGAIVKFGNRIDGIEVFREEAAVMLDRDGGLVAIGGFVSGGQVAGSFAVPVPEAIGVALGDWSFADGIYAAIRLSESRDGHDYYTVDGDPVSGDGSRVKSAIRVKPVLFRMPGKLLPAYYIEVELDDGQDEGEIDRYAYVVDANDRTVLYRRDQTANDAFSYRAFAEGTGINLPFPSPAGRDGFPHPTGSPNGYQPVIVPQSNVITLQNAPFSKNDPWLAPGATTTTGNNVDAFADLVAPDGFNGTDLRASATSPGVFDYAHDPALQPGATQNQIRASVTSLFYLNNFLHDWYYDAGFDEAAGNAQASNFGRGGIGNDSIIAEAQDYSGRSNANMSTPSDGARPRMRMYIFTATQSIAVTVNAPAAIAGVKQSTGAQFGPSAFTKNGPVVTSSPADGCAPIGAGVSGKIALIDRGTCTFKTKVANAQIAGATAVVIANNVTGAPITMADDATISTVVTIPAVMITQADGTAMKAQLPSPGVDITMVSTSGTDRDGTIDNTIVSHEWGHYISNRLIADANGLNTNMGDGMGEGWADFHALLLLSKAADAQIPSNANFNGVYTIGAYALGGAAGTNNQSYYYGIRRYPYSRDMTKNPLTFKHVQNGVALPATPAARFGSDGSTNAEVHNTGEVWASMLWECYTNLLNDTGRLTFDQAQDRMKRYLVAGYKMTPVSPTFTEARDALLSAMAAQDSQDYGLCLAGFAKRGAGAGAVSPDRYSATNVGVTESFIANGALTIVSATMTDDRVSCDTDGYVDDGETGTLTITIRNTGATTLSSTTGVVSSPNTHIVFPNGPNVVFPATSPGQQTTITVPVQVSGATTFEPAIITVSVDDPGLQVTRPVLQSVTFIVNADEGTNQSKTDTVETNITAWTTGNSISNPSADFTWHRIAISGTDHRWLGPDAASPQLTWLQSPALNVAATGNFSFTFRHRFSFETDSSGDYDGGQVQLSTDGGTTWIDIGASASPGYTGTFATYSGNVNPLQGLPGYVRQNSAWPALETVTVSLGTAYAGQTVRIRFAIGTDTGGSGPGWEIDDIAFNNITNSPFTALVGQGASCQYSIATVSGTPQNAAPGAAFAQPLKVLVKTSAGAIAVGVPVTFTAPATGASATFGGAATVQTDATGVATSPVLTANATAGSYLVKAAVGGQSAAFSLANSGSLPAVTIDIDGDGRYDALTDGLMIIRYLFGITGNAMAANAVTATGARTSPAAIMQYLAANRTALDIDGNGTADALTDGLLIVRYLFGVRGTALVANAIAPNATRTSAAQVEPVIAALMP